MTTLRLPGDHDTSTLHGAGAPFDPSPRVFSRDAVRAVDREAIEAFGIPGIVLMENAARALLQVATTMLPSRAARVVIICGAGNNGGDGWALARHLHNLGHVPIVVALGEPRVGSDAATNRATARAMKIDTVTAPEDSEPPAADLVVDAIFGTGLSRDVTGAPAEAIAWINDHAAPVLAVDIPSGLDAETGRPLGVAVRATKTVTFVGYKPGLLVSAARDFVGDVLIGDIGAPRALVERCGTPMI